MKNKAETKPMSILLYGVPKIGLSTLASKMPDPLFLNLDDDLTYINPEKEIKITSWDDFIQAGAEISEGKHASGWLILAHIERLWAYVCDDITKESNNKNGSAAQNISELSYAEWRIAIDLFEKKLAKLMTLRNTVLLSHEIAEVRNIRGLERTHFLANLERKASLVVLNLVDATGRLYSIEQDVRILSFVSQENQITGSRIPELQNRKFIFQDKDMTAFIQVIKAMKGAHQSTRRNTDETTRGSEKSVKGTVFKRSHPAAH
jgi:hypothetical protein